MSHCTIPDRPVNKKNVSRHTAYTPNELSILLEALDEEAISYRPIYAKICGSVNAGVLLAFLLAMYQDFNFSEFCITNEELKDHMGAAMGLSAIKAAKKILENLNFITVSRRGIPCRSNYTINQQAITEACQLQGSKK